MPKQEDILGSGNPEDWEEKDGALELKEKLFTPEETELAEFGFEKERLFKLIFMFKNQQDNPINRVERDYYSNKAKKLIKGFTAEKINTIVKLLGKINQASNLISTSRQSVDKDYGGVESWTDGIIHYGFYVGNSNHNEKEKRSYLWRIEEDESLNLEEKARKKEEIRAEHKRDILVLRQLKEYYDNNKELQKALEEANQILGPLLAELPDNL